MSPQVSKEDWENDEQLVYLTYREMATLVMLVKQFAPDSGQEVSKILDGAVAKFAVELKPVLYDEDVKKLGLE